ncbi:MULTISPECIES: hypothetical protein [Roseivirga]|jgi:hypothetical protein|uniref:Uncharacterized protein n=1 Tax=Roseivirga thermotolerans TaxID=1758176 RepID=A0ABQ3IBR4_9BACT|nr:MULTISPECIES: hypothetical protein [Roseivirga]GHE74489.1 hypothetical protein GCM10011340_33830 [Roseivirga thermotolerans]|tara:strand:+ start:35422 stop:35808 length:387 start_codon:yes stop_codon:yes gene_type:complete
MKEEFYFKRLPDLSKDEVNYLSQVPDFSLDADNYADFELQSCWSYGPLGICLRQEADRIRAYFFIYGVKVGSATLLKTKPCVGWGYDENGIKVSIEVCADFNRRRVVARGKICLFIACAEFNQVIFNW